MRKLSRSARMSRYTNIKDLRGRKSRRRSNNRFVAWFRGLTIKQRILAITSPIVLVMIAIPLITYIVLANDIRDRERLMNRNNTGIVLQDKNGETFYSIGRAEHRNDIKLDDVSDFTKKALIASEDKDFYKHSGFSIAGIGRALITRNGGGSTLTQQLVKNTLLSDQRSYLRKYQELFMSIAVEQNYTKDQILEMYLNSVYYGEDAFGIEEAARVYFDKTPKDLDLAESAMLIGLLPAPSAYSPISGNRDYAIKRQSLVLGRMVQEGYITEEQKEAAEAEELKYNQAPSKQNSIAPHFVEMVVNELSEKYGYERVMRSGYQIRTTLDISIQKQLNDNIQKNIKYINNMGGSNASGIVVDPKNGEIRALVGSADYDNEKWGKVNMVTTPRQPASTFKPIYYAYALAEGVITPATILDDKVIDFGGGYIPRDADRNETSRNKASVRQSLSWSLNIPSVHVMKKYSIDNSIRAAKNLGIDIDENKNYGLSFAIGSAEVPLYQMVHAYTAFANDGRQFEYVKITSIEDKFSKKIYKAKYENRQAITREGAYLISDILSDNVVRSRMFGSSLTVNNHTVAVKTGTTNDNRDAYTIGYNPQYVVGVWVGNNDNSPMYSGGSDMAGPIWRNTMTNILAGKERVEFVRPGGIVERAVCRENGGLADKKGENTYNEVFLAGSLPTEKCNAEPVTIEVCDVNKGEVIKINEDDFDETTQRKDISDCSPPTMRVCELDTGDVVSIKKDEYDDTRYSTDITNCRSRNSIENNSVKACDISTHTVVTIDKDKVDGVMYIDEDNYEIRPDGCYSINPSV